ALRELENHKPVKAVICTDIDFKTAEFLAVWFMDHAQTIFQQLPSKPKNYRVLKTNEAQFFDALTKDFDFAFALETANSLSIAKGTAERFLKKFRLVGLVTRLSHGKY